MQTVKARAQWRSVAGMWKVTHPNVPNTYWATRPHDAAVHMVIEAAKGVRHEQRT